MIGEFCIGETAISDVLESAAAGGGISGVFIEAIYQNPSIAAVYGHPFVQAVYAHPKTQAFSESG